MMFIGTVKVFGQGLIEVKPVILNQLQNAVGKDRLAQRSGFKD
jgi:hypothetical protein